MENVLARKIDSLYQDEKLNIIEINLYSKLIKKHSKNNVKKNDEIAKELFNQLLDTNGEKNSDKC